MLVFDAWTFGPNLVLLVAGCAGLAAALLLFEWARRTVRGQYFSYIFARDTPTFLCTSGPYAHIRNPFYTSYLVTMASTALMFPSLFNIAAEYTSYKARTGRFVPRLRR